MLVALGYHAGDLAQAQRLADWMRELGPYPGHSLLVARDSSTLARPFADVGFDSVEEIVLSDEHHKWPESANYVFGKCAKHVQYALKAPYWLWLEPDAVPVSRDWLDALEAEHRRGNKPFMGDLVPGGADSIDHMSGIGVYPGKLTDYAGLATVALETAWDLLAADLILPQAHITELIQHNWRPPDFANAEEMRAELNPQTVLYHKDKTGRLIELLRANLQVPVLAEPMKRTSAGASPEEGGEARESIPAKVDHQAKAIKDQDSCGLQSISKPWESPHDSIEAIKSLCAELKSYCTAPAHTSKVRKELKIAGVIR